MSFQEIRRRLPFQIAFRAESAASTYDDIENAYDVAINGVPFLLKIDEQHPWTRGTAQVKKQQLDTSAEPGEQSLTGWWLRSQSSLHWGAGLRYGDPELDNTASFRYYQSEGVDPWTPGQVTLLPGTELLASAGGAVRMVAGVYLGADAYYRSSVGNLYRGTEDGTETTVYTAGSTILDLTTDGDDVYFAAGAKIYKAAHGTTTVTEEWDFTGTSVALGWVKQRIIAGIDNAIYVPEFGNPALPTAVYEHPNEDWVWTDIAEGPEAIYVSGYVGSRSVIIRLSLDTQGDIPTLTNATVVAELPSGEVVHSMRGYLGTFLGLGTSKGVRVATFQANGSILVGPLIEAPMPVMCIEAKGTHFLAGFSDSMADGTSGLLRVDLTTQFDNAQFPYATDLRAHAAGVVHSVVVLPISGKVLFGVADQGVFGETAALESEGFLTTARQRYNTVWPKLFKRFNVRGDFTGPMSISTVDDTGTEINVLSISSSMDQAQDFAINYPDGPQEFLSLKFILHQDPDDDTTGTVFRSYQLKAIPGGPRPRQFSLPCLCFDFERDRKEILRGTKGWAWERLRAVEELDASGDVVILQDLRLGVADLCTIEAIEFSQAQPRGANTVGGLLTIVLRTLSS